MCPNFISDLIGESSIFCCEDRIIHLVFSKEQIPANLWRKSHFSHSMYCRSLLVPLLLLQVYGQVDFVDLDGEAVVAPYRWRRVESYRAVTALVLIDDEFFQEFPVEVGASTTGLAGAELSTFSTLSPGRYSVQIKLADSQSGEWLNIESQRRTLVVDILSTAGPQVHTSKKIPVWAVEQRTIGWVEEASCEQMQEGDSSYLPSPECISEERAEEDNKCVRELQRDLYDTQHVHCRRLVSSTIPPWGFASNARGHKTMYIDLRWGGRGLMAVHV